MGPTLGAAIAAASHGEDLAAAILTFVSFGTGVALAIVAFAYGSRRALGGRAKVLQRLARFAKPIFGALLALIGLLVLTGLDCRVEAVGLALMPGWLMNLMARY